MHNLPPQRTRGTRAGFPLQPNVTEHMMDVAAAMAIHAYEVKHTCWRGGGQGRQKRRRGQGKRGRRAGFERERQVTSGT